MMVHIGHKHFPLQLGNLNRTCKELQFITCDWKFNILTCDYKNAIGQLQTYNVIASYKVAIVCKLWSLVTRLQLLQVSKFLSLSCNCKKYWMPELSFKSGNCRYVYFLSQKDTAQRQRLVGSQFYKINTLFQIFCFYNKYQMQLNVIFNNTM